MSSVRGWTHFCRKKIHVIHHVSSRACDWEVPLIRGNWRDDGPVVGHVRRRRMSSFNIFQLRLHYHIISAAFAVRMASVRRDRCWYHLNMSSLLPRFLFQMADSLPIPRVKHFNRFYMKHYTFSSVVFSVGMHVH